MKPTIQNLAWDRMTRRSFLQIAAASAAASGFRFTPSGQAAEGVSVQLPAEVKITAITTAKHAVRHPRKIGLNSIHDHGAGHDETLVRVQTSAGVEGFGNGFPAQALGKTLGDLLEVRDNRLCLRPEARPMINPNSEAVLLDIVGKLLKRPAGELLGSIIRREVPCYDGSIYMRDLDNESFIAADTASGREAGHTRYKVKIGRGHWLKDRVKGYDRDLWAIRTVRAAAGENCQVLVDANNFYTLEESIQLLRDTASTALYWMEEMFDEKKKEDYHKLRDTIKELKLPTLLADGESGRGEGELLELIKEGVIQVSQPDIRTLGIFAYRDYAELIKPFGAGAAPHAWAKQIGVLECCLMGQVIPNFALIEDCRLSSDVVKLPGLSIRNGAMILDQSPGLGIVIDEAAYQKECAPHARTIKA